MNPVPRRDTLQRLQRGEEPRVVGVSDSMRDPSRINNRHETFNVRDEPLNTMEVNVGWEALSSLCLKLKSQQSDVEEPDGEPLETEKPMCDMELARKQEELWQIEQKILYKKAAIALKSVNFGFSADEQTEEGKGESLCDRVTLILQQRRSLGALPELWPPRKKMTSSRNGLLLEDHPLKLRVRALMKRRCSNLSVTPAKIEVPVAAPPAPAKEGSRDVGFQRFLSVLNKGVDISYLSRIVNTDCETQPSHSGDEEKTDVTEDEPRSRSRSNSPPLVKRKRSREEGKPTEFQNNQLQSVLQTLGMSLEKEEMSKLTDRTQERLFGRRPEGRKEEKSQQKGSDNCKRASVPPSDGASHPPDPGSSHENPPHTRDTQSECSGSGEDPWVTEEAQMQRDVNGESANSMETSFNQYQYSQEPACSHPAYPAAYSQYYNVPQHFQYAAYHGAAVDPYSSYTQGVTPAPLDPSSYPYLPVGDPRFQGHFQYAQPPRPLLQGFPPGVNPDLSESEGQVGSGGQRCLKAVATVSRCKLRNKPRKLLVPVKRVNKGSFPVSVPTIVTKVGPKNKKKKKKVMKESQQEQTLKRILQNMHAEEAAWPQAEVEKMPMEIEKREKVKAFLAAKIESLRTKKT